MAAINAARIAGAGRIIAVDNNPAKLQLATKLGATDLVNASDGDAVERVKEMTGGGVHHAIECIGLKTTAEQAFKMTMRGGTATIVGMVPYGQSVDVHGFDLLLGRRLQGCFMGGGSFRIDMPRLADLYIQGRLHLDDFISDRIPLEEINDGFAAMKSGKTLRTLIEFQ